MSHGHMHRNRGSLRRFIRAEAGMESFPYTAAYPLDYGARYQAYGRPSTWSIPGGYFESEIANSRFIPSATATRAPSFVPSGGGVPMRPIAYDPPFRPPVLPPRPPPPEVSCNKEDMESALRNLQRAKAAYARAQSIYSRAKDIYQTCKTKQEKLAAAKAMAEAEVAAAEAAKAAEKAAAQRAKAEYMARKEAEYAAAKAEHRAREEAERRARKEAELAAARELLEPEPTPVVVPFLPPPGVDPFEIGTGTASFSTKPAMPGSTGRGVAAGPLMGSSTGTSRFPASMTRPSDYGYGGWWQNFWGTGGDAAAEGAAKTAGETAAKAGTQSAAKGGFWKGAGSGLIDMTGGLLNTLFTNNANRNAQNAMLQSQENIAMMQIHADNEARIAIARETNKPTGGLGAGTIILALGGVGIVGGVGYMLLRTKKKK